MAASESDHCGDASDPHGSCEPDVGAGEASGTVSKAWSFERIVRIDSAGAVWDLCRLLFGDV